MTCEEFSNEFDILYNSITSNQAPGLDEYEKSVFLTKAQDEIIKAYFNPKRNKTLEGFDGSERRQIDFSMLVRTSDLINNGPIYFGYLDTLIAPGSNATSKEEMERVYGAWAVRDSNGNLVNFSSPSLEFRTFVRDVEEKVKQGIYTKKEFADPTYSANGHVVYFYNNGVDFNDSIFDGRQNSKSVELPKNLNIMMILNEYVIVKRDNADTRLEVVPLMYTEYSRLMSKPYKRPTKNQAWRLLDNDSNNRADLVVGGNDIITKYSIRYVKRPSPIILTDLSSDSLKIDGRGGKIECELDPILHREILQRAVEMAKAVYMGDLTSTLVLGQTSQTPIGYVASPNNRQ